MAERCTLEKRGLLWCAISAEIVWVCTDYADLRVHVFSSDEAMERFGKESQIVTSSHRGDLDWIAGFVLGANTRFLHVSYIFIVRAIEPSKSVVVLFNLQWLRTLPTWS